MSSIYDENTATAANSWESIARASTGGQLLSDNTPDVLLNTPLYGIHHPESLHSFCNIYHVFVPKPCSVCTNLVIPFVQACSCLRCRCLVHRNCINKSSTCLYFTFHDWNTISSTNLVNTEITNGMTHFRGLDVEDIVKKAILIPHVLGFTPEPGSELCIWRSILRAVAMNEHVAQNMRGSAASVIHTNIPNVLPNNWCDEAEVTSCLESILDDSSSFAGVVANVCQSVLLALDLPDITNYYRHCREGLDTVICALLSRHLQSKRLPEEVEFEGRVLHSICICIDDYIMRMEFGILYEKLFALAIKLSRTQRYAVDTYAIVTMYSNRSDAERYGLSTIPNEVRNELRQLGQSLRACRTAYGKLKIIVKILQLLSGSLRQEDDYERVDTYISADDAREKAEENSDLLEGYYYCQTTAFTSLNIKSCADDGHHDQRRTTSEDNECGISDWDKTIREPITFEDVHDIKVTRDDGQDTITDSRSPEQSQGKANFSNYEEFGSSRSKCDSSRASENWINVATTIPASVHVPNHSTVDDRSGINTAGEINKNNQIVESNAPTMRKASSSAIDTDSLIAVFIELIATQMESNEVQWTAEYLYITSALLRDTGDMLNGAEGYALVTLEQSIHVLLQVDTSTVADESFDAVDSSGIVVNAELDRTVDEEDESCQWVDAVAASFAEPGRMHLKHSEHET